MPQPNESKNITIGGAIAYINATEIGFVKSGVKLKNTNKAVGVKADITGDTEIAFFNMPGGCEAEFNVVTSTPERVKALFDSMYYRNGEIQDDNRSGKQLRDFPFTFLRQSVLSDSTLSTNGSSQIPKGVVVNGYDVSYEPDKPNEVKIKIKGLPDLSKPNFPSVRYNSNITPPPPTILFIDTINAGNYTVKPASITVTGVTGAALDSTINSDGSLNIFCTNYGTGFLADVETWKTLTITGGTSTTAASARVRMG